MTDCRVMATRTCPPDMCRGLPCARFEEDDEAKVATRWAPQLEDSFGAERLYEFRSTESAAVRLWVVWLDDNGVPLNHDHVVDLPRPPEAARMRFKATWLPE